MSGLAGVHSASPLELLRLPAVDGHSPSAAIAVYRTRFVCVVLAENLAGLIRKALVRGHRRPVAELVQLRPIRSLARFLWYAHRSKSNRDGPAVVQGTISTGMPIRHFKLARPPVLD
jgi:hypothetical protein